MTVCIVTILYPDYSFKAFNNNNETIIINDNNWHLREQLSFNACYAEGEIADEKFTISDLQKTRKKHRNLHLFLTSLFPVGLIILLLCFFLESQGVLIFLFIIWALVFEIPSIKEICKFSKNTDIAFMNQKLCEYADKRRKGIKCPDTGNSKSGKLISKILNKMFRFDEEK